VAIVGFGPVGAVLAGLLGVRGIKTLVIDREWDVFKLPRAARIDHTGLRTLQELGLLDEVLPTVVSNAGLDFITAGGQLLVRVPSSLTSSSDISPSMYFQQPDLDRRIRVAVSAMPSVEIRLGTEVTNVESGSDGAVLTCVEPSGKAYKVEASWVVGCDGAWSLMRGITGHALGFIYHTIYTLLHGATIVLIEDFARPEVALTAIQRYGLGTFTAITASWARMMDVLIANPDLAVPLPTLRGYAMWQSASSSAVYEWWKALGIELMNNFVSRPRSTRCRSSSASCSPWAGCWSMPTPRCWTKLSNPSPACTPLAARWGGCKEVHPTVTRVAGRRRRPLVCSRQSTPCQPGPWKSEGYLR
jgi:hypothetical protein